MKWSMLLVLVAGFSLFVRTARADSASQDKDKLKGTWTVVSAERNGEKAPDEKIKNVKVIFRTEKVLVTDGDRDDQAEYKLDTSKTPNAIDFMPVKEKKIVLGIYELDGDTLKVCYDPGENVKDRPEEFTSKGGKNGRVLMVLKREKE